MTPTPDTTTPRPGILELLGYADLEDHVVHLTIERDTYRNLLHSALDKLHAAHVLGQRQRATIVRQRETIRRLHTAERTRASERRAA